MAWTHAHSDVAVEMLFKTGESVIATQRVFHTPFKLQFGMIQMKFSTHSIFYPEQCHSNIK